MLDERGELDGQECLEERLQMKMNHIEAGGRTEPALWLLPFLLVHASLFLSSTTMIE